MLDVQSTPRRLQKEGSRYRGSFRCFYASICSIFPTTKHRIVFYLAKKTPIYLHICNIFTTFARKNKRMNRMLQQNLIERKQYMQQLRDLRDQNVIKVISGVRRCGNKCFAIAIL